MKVYKERREGEKGTEIAVSSGRRGRTGRRTGKWRTGKEEI
jgi:hypothetical protein